MPESTLPDGTEVELIAGVGWRLRGGGELPLHQWPDGSYRYWAYRSIAYTVGYGNYPVARLFKAARSVNGHILDIRHAPRSERPEWCEEALAATFGVRYEHLPALGNRQYRASRTGSAEPEIVDMEAGAARVRAVMEETGRSPVLICACSDFARCHRARVALELASTAGIETRELPLWV